MSWIFINVLGFGESSFELPLMDPSLDAYTVLKDDDYKSPNIGLEDSQELLQKLGLSQVFVIDLLVFF